MKKSIIFLILTAMLLTTIVPMTAFAETPEDYAGNLVAYWDFEGSTDAEKLKDKGTGESVKNNLTVGNCVVTNTVTGYGENIDPVTYENGKVTIPDSDGTALIANIANNDGFSALNSVTLGMKVNVATAATNVYLAWRTNSFGLKVLKSGDGYNLIYHSSAVTNSADYYGDPFGGKVFTAGKDYYIFVTVVANSTNVSITGYYSEDGKTFTAGQTITKLTKWSGYAWRNADGTDITFGKAMNVYAKKGSALTYDAIWVFNTAVNANSLPTIVQDKVNYATDNTAKAAPTYRGLQLSPVTDNKFSTRLVATVDSLNYAEVGFEVKVTNYKGSNSGDIPQVYTATEVYKAIMGRNDDGVGGTVVYNASDLGGEYIYALAIQNIPTDAAVTFEVTTYYKTAIDGDRIPGESYTITVDNGRLVSQAVVTTPEA